MRLSTSLKQIVSSLIAMIYIAIILIVFYGCGGIDTSEGSAADTTGNESITLSWIPPTQNTDGTELTDLAGHRIYYDPKYSGQDTSMYTYSVDVVLGDRASISLPNSGSWYFVVVAFDVDGNESTPSNVANYTSS